MIINFKINHYLYLTFEKKILNQILVRNFGKRPGPTDLSKVGKAFGPHVPKVTTLPNAQNQQPNSLPVVHKESNELNGPKIDQKSDISSNTWSNSSLSEKIDTSVVPVKKGVQFIWKGSGNSSDATPSASTASGEQELLDLAEEYGLTTYEKTDKTEGAGYGGSPKLTKKGLISLSDHYKPTIIKKEDVPLGGTENIPFKAGLLVSDHENILLTPIQTHIIVVFSIPHDKFLAVGILTSQKNQEFLSKSQIYNTEKGQYFRYLLKPKIVPPELFENNQEATKYVNLVDNRAKLNALTKQFLDESSEVDVYDGKTVTANVLQAMIVTEFENENNKNSTVSTVQTVEPSEASNIKDKDIDLQNKKINELND